jgi:putative DNA primase/helicase
MGVWDGVVNCPLENAKIRFENVLVFVGGQGVRKTQFFEDLLPKQFRDYVATGIHLDPSDKDSIMLAISAGITELGELDFTFAKDIARLKAFLSLKTDKFRRPYDRVEREFQRRTSFCASVNDDEFLVDALSL